MANSFKYNDTNFGIGDTVSVSLRVVEGEKTRQQDFAGLLIAISGRENNKSFTVRKISTASIGVERILPVNSPEILGIKLVSKGSIRRAKLYYLRDRLGKSALRVKSDKVSEKPKKKVVTKKNEQAKPKSGDSGRKVSKKPVTG